MSEHQEQSALFRWIDYMASYYPELALCYAIPNGGLRNKITAAKLKREGVKSGVPDICLPVSRGGSIGLYIELKTKTGRATKNQQWWIESLSAQGHVSAICYGWESAKTLIESYMGMTR